jgi:S-adenosylmethionine:tRNA ribosyltransferase-isomerase
MRATLSRPTGVPRGTGASDKKILHRDATSERWFELPDELSATEPPEAHGQARDRMRLLVTGSTGIVHSRFDQLGDYLAPGDVLVVNNSATLPAAIDGDRLGRDPIAVHRAARLDDRSWLVELRPRVAATGPVDDAGPGDEVQLPEGVQLRLVTPYRSSPRLWRATVSLAADDDVAYLNRVGQPIRYAYVPRLWPMWAYQTVFATYPGSAEMPSAARPFSPELVTSLISVGVTVAPITLHTGVSSLEEGEPPTSEPFDVPESTARIVNSARAAGRRIVAVGTTATRALESAVSPAGHVEPRHGWTDLVLGPDHTARIVGGLITGWHAPGASHLHLLEAVAGRDVVRAAYRAAIDAGYLWHEFGDSCLLLPH